MPELLRHKKSITMMKITTTPTAVTVGTPSSPSASLLTITPTPTTPPSKPLPIATAAAIMVSTTTTTGKAATVAAVLGRDDQSSSSSASTSPISLTASSPTTTISPASTQPLSPILVNGLETSFFDQATEALSPQRPRLSPSSSSSSLSLSLSFSSSPSSSFTNPDEQSAILTAVLHKKDSGTSMASTATAVETGAEAESTETDVYPPEVFEAGTSKGNDITGTAHINCNSRNLARKASARRVPQPDTAGQYSATIAAPTGRVLTRPLSTSKLSSDPTAAPHILPIQRNNLAGFNLATLGQLSPSASTAAAGGMMTMSRSETLAFLNANSNNSYFTVHPGSSSRVSSQYGDLHGPMQGGTGTSGTATQNLDGIVLPTTQPGSNSRTTMCGSDAISLLDLEDSHNDLVMIDSNGNSSGSGVVGPAIVGETIASASAFVTSSSAGSNGSANHRHLSGPQHHNGTLSTSSAARLSGIVGSGSGSGNGGGLHLSSSSSHLAGGPLPCPPSSSNNHNNNNGPRASLPSLTSQAKRDAMQRAAMIAAMQQNGGTKILAAQRVGRRQDRPSRNIRFGEFHRICEIEHEFDQGKPLIANGRILIHTARAFRIEENCEKREELLYLFSDVLVTGTKLPTLPSGKSTNKIDNDGHKQGLEQHISSTSSTAQNHSDVSNSTEIVNSDNSVSYNKKDISDAVQQELLMKTFIDKTERNAPGSTTSNNEMRSENPYAGHLKNQHISRLTQVQADAVEDDERPLLKISAPQLSLLLLFESTPIRDSFLALINETIVAHKHHLLFQSKYLADLKKFKRHSAFSFDTSFLKTWGIPGGLNLGSIKINNNFNNGSGNGAVGPNGTSFTASPVTSPGGSAFDPFHYQQFLNLNRPQSMAGSLFNFALNGGAFSPFTSGDHSKESSYATLRGTSAANALQYHHQQQQQILQQQLKNRPPSWMTGASTGRPGIDRTLSGSAFDALWFMKGNNGGYGGGDQNKPRRSAIEVVSAPFSSAHGDGEGKRKNAEDDSESSGSAASSLYSSSSSTNLSNLVATTATGSESNGGDNKNSQNQDNNNSGNSYNSKQTLSRASGYILPSSNNSTMMMTGTLRNGSDWVRDEDAAVCMVCSVTKFGVLVRKHHCRLCGRVICWKCCQMKGVALVGDVSAGNMIPSELRKPIRVCLDCIEQDALQDQHQQKQQPQPQQPQQPEQSQQQHSPVSTSFPFQGVFGRLMSSTSTSPQLVTSISNTSANSTVAMSQAHSQMPFYPRGGHGRTGRSYPHHHRASFYRIDVERVGEEDEEEQEEQEGKESEEDRGQSQGESKGNERANVGDQGITTGAIEGAEGSSAAFGLEAMESTDGLRPNRNSVIKSNHSTLRLKDLDPADINEDEVNNQILTLESEVQDLLIQNAPLMFGAATSSQNARGGRSSGAAASASKTRVIRGIPKELLQGAAETAVALEDSKVDVIVDEDGCVEEEEKTIEELLAEQDEQLKHFLTR
ncbi:Zinc finger FYVE domain-containing protein 26 [Lobosporangium transversale]|uniref:FYVE-type domain-containing protein n=1 Tax=Lobosporangium transversale TaxID=64571 RepID=A0A1Y2H4H6_9FUNG|nr:hypothetical protein BCR41DRAFT_417757 [Lobosporangium transversale]KAF9916876.1 Zinc finger FYVE domain-containing protein 26 [Lobosporangium transversale]ORZ28613.1 hypothetical protein BCR41DRAFT_417757 [Lobosporangium transversale]|eukprot:XP_021886286.1 hypothetical protein BCR41DRAFT_417757 [Lobosporangium transversale]